MEKYLHSAKATFKRIRNQILKGADPERAARRDYENACYYFELMNEDSYSTECLSKSVAHILQRELYTMGNTGLLRRDDSSSTTSRGLETPRTEELAFLAYSSFQVSTREGWRGLPPLKRHP